MDVELTLQLRFWYVVKSRSSTSSTRNRPSLSHCSFSARASTATMPFWWPSLMRTGVVMPTDRRRWAAYAASASG